MSTPSSEETESTLTAPYDYLARNPGKNFRSRFINAFNQVLDAPPEVVEMTSYIVSKLHTVSLLFDDVEDSATLRRGKPAAHCIFGIPRTINTANLVVLETIREVRERMPGAEAILLDELINLHKGQGRELFWRDTNVCPSESEYLQMANDKTAGLYRLAVRLLQTGSPNSIDLVRVANAMGLLYQVRDDYLNLVDENFQKTKGFAEDVSEGKFSFPILHALTAPQHTANADELRSILLLRTTDAGIKREAVDIIAAAGSLAYTKQFIAHLAEQCRALITDLELSNPQPLLQVVDVLAQI